MIAKSATRKTYRIPSSLYWAQYWYPCPILILATFQLFMALIIFGMEIGNAVVDLFRANVYSGFWSLPFMILAIMTAYACVCATQTQTKAMVALVFQIIAILVMLTVIGFLIVIIVSNFKLCLGVQCSQSTSTSSSSSSYTSLKQAFIGCELAASIIYTILAFIYVILYIKCYNNVSKIHPIVRSLPRHTSFHNSTLSSSSRVVQPRSLSNINSNSENLKEQTSASSTRLMKYSGAEKVCPNCKHISPYLPEGDILECPKCGYQSNLVEHAQQS